MTSGLRWILIQRPIEADVYFVGYAYPVTTHWLIHPLFACADADSATATSCDHLRPPSPHSGHPCRFHPHGVGRETVFCTKYFGRQILFTRSSITIISLRRKTKVGWHVSGRRFPRERGTPRSRGCGRDTSPRMATNCQPKVLFKKKKHNSFYLSADGDLRAPCGVHCGPRPRKATGRAGPLSLPALSQADPPHTDPTFPTADHISTPLRQRGSHKHS
ncbi:hypothetical protein B296_00026449 [Ensete ventricosum]|uniref:Uncharacterized protein n=1 Tax=Ensete ventricosum TaxID=4639 RepID=A0A427ARP0_ENSVE|nr:hypothetical protein B296_00026449 [Ensete ventricosum]